MRHEVTNEEHRSIAEKLHAIATLYAAILIELDDASIDIKVQEFRHRVHPDDLIELEAFLSDNTQIHIELVHTK